MRLPELTNISGFNRYRRKRPKVGASIFDSGLSHTRRSDASEKREEKSVATFGRFRLWTNFESSSVSVMMPLEAKFFIAAFKLLLHKILNEIVLCYFLNSPKLRNSKNWT